MPPQYERYDGPLMAGRTYRKATRKGADPSAPNPLASADSERSFKAQERGAATRGDAAESAYLDRATGFNAREGFEDTARGGFNMVSEDLKEAIGDLRGSQVATGRLKTGFADVDEDRLTRSVYRDFGNTLAQNALNAQGQQIQSDANLGRFGNTVAERAASMSAGSIDRKTAAEAARRKRRGGIGSLLGAGVGTLLGGPGVGSAIGGALGELF